MSFAATHLVGFGVGSVASFAPTDIANLHSWYRADLGVTDSSGVSDWNDQSGNGRDLTEATNKPTYQATGGPNSLPCVSFDGTNDILSDTFTSLAQPFHGFAIIKTTTVSGVAGLICGAVSGERFHDTQGGCFVYFGGTGITRSPAHSDTTTWYLWEYNINGASSSVIRGSDAATTGDVGSGALTGLTLGQLPGFGFGAFFIAEFALYSAVISGANLTSLRSYFASRYGVATT
jgi:hypothetical protein